MKPTFFFHYKYNFFRLFVVKSVYLQRRGIMKVKWLSVLFASCWCSCLAQTRISGFSDQYKSENTLGEYTFGYNEDHSSGGSFRRESSDRFGNKVGSYGLRVGDGRVRIVNYIADKNGFRADVVSNEPGMESQDSNEFLKVTKKSIYSILVPGFKYSSEAPHVSFEGGQEDSSPLDVVKDEIEHQYLNSDDSQVKGFGKVHSSQDEDHGNVYSSQHEDHANMFLSQAEDHVNVYSNQDEDHVNVYSNRDEDHGNVYSIQDEGHGNVYSIQGEGHRNVQSNQDEGHGKVYSNQNDHGNIYANEDGNLRNLHSDTDENFRDVFPAGEGIPSSVYIDEERAFADERAGYEYRHGSETISQNHTIIDQMKEESSDVPATFEATSKHDASIVGVERLNGNYSISPSRDDRENNNKAQRSDVVTIDKQAYKSKAIASESAEHSVFQGFNNTLQKDVVMNENTTHSTTVMA